MLVAGAWARASFGAPVSAAYLTLVNRGATPLVFTGASSPRARSVQLHETRVGADGAAHMHHGDEGFPLPADGAPLRLAPGGRHIMLMGLSPPLQPGERLPLVLHFDAAPDLSLELPVRAAAPEGS